jgi:2-(1,2-epoxy-1,2-dihydrophenyl)acetyl-CoA isomerase
MDDAHDAGLLVALDGAITVLTIERPDRRNAIDLDTADALVVALREADADRSVRAVVLTAAGTESFCTGADLSGGAPIGNTLDYRFVTERHAAIFRTMWELETPIVSAVNGRVAGVGFMLALLADVIVADAEARWSHVFTRLGMIPHAGDTVFLPHLIPLHRLSELALLGDTVTSQQLHEWGVVTLAVPAGEVRTRALETAQRLADGPTRALGLARRLYRRSLIPDVDAALERERAALALISTTSDRAEGVRAMQENRRPNFTGD